MLHKRYFDVDEFPLHITCLIDCNVLIKNVGKTASHFWSIVFHDVDTNTDHFLSFCLNISNSEHCGGRGLLLSQQTKNQHITELFAGHTFSKPLLRKVYEEYQEN